MATASLDLEPWIGQRSSTFRFALIDGVTGESKGDIHPLREDVPVLTHDTQRTIKRTLTMSLGVEDSALISPVRDRVLVYMVTGSVEYPLGRYMFADATTAQWTSGELASCSLMDEMFIVDQPMESAFAATGLFNSNVTLTMQRLMQQLPQITYQFPPCPQSATGSWSAGTSRAKVLSDLCTQGGLFSPWFDNDGVLRAVLSFDPADAVPTIDLDAGSRVIRGTIANTNDLLEAPNRFIVISNGATGVEAQSPAYGTYDVPNSAPHSILNRGFVIPNVREIQTSGSSAAAAAAKAIGIASTVFERVQLDTAPDPRHDSYDVILWQGELWLELSWSMNLIEGGTMSHVMRKAYS